MLRRATEQIRATDSVFLRLECINGRDTHYKLAPITECTFPVLRVDGTAKSVVIERPNDLVENASRHRIAIAPKPEHDTRTIQASYAVPTTSTVRYYPTSD